VRAATKHEEREERRGEERRGGREGGTERDVKTVQDNSLEVSLAVVTALH
jgi:hypothetical protein